MILAMIMAIENEEERSFVEAVYDEYHVNMLAICYDVLRNQADAEDALVDAFESIISNVQRIQAIPEQKLPAFLNICAQNAAIDIYRRNAKGNELFTSAKFYSEAADGDIQNDFPDKSFDLEKIVLGKELIVEVCRMIETFPPKLKAVVLLKWQYGYPNGEIAELLNISESSVSSHIHRARKRLAKLLAQKNLTV